MEESQRILKHLTEVEEAAEDVLADKQQMLDLDTKRHRNREALAALRGGGEADGDKVKVCFGDMFIKLPRKTTRDMIQKDQMQLDKEINDIRKRLKAKVNHLSELQGKPELTAYNLSPLSKDEMNAIKQILR